MERAEVGELRERGDVPRGAREVDDDEVRVRGALREEVLVRGVGGECGEEDVAVGEEGEGGELGRVDVLCGRVSGAGAGGRGCTHEKELAGLPVPDEQLGDDVVVGRLG